MKVLRSKASHWRLLSLCWASGCAGRVLLPFSEGEDAVSAALPPLLFSNQSHSFNQLTNSLFSSSNCACAWSACCCTSRGRSRTSGTDSAAAITSTSASAPCSRAASSILPKRGSSGNRARSRPRRVKVLSSSTAPSSASKSQPSAMARPDGASIKGKCSTAPKPRACIRKITAASEERRISGSVKAGLALKSASSYRRMHTPSATRPQRPARCRAAAWLMGSISNCSTFCR